MQVDNWPAPPKKRPRNIGLIAITVIATILILGVIGGLMGAGQTTGTAIDHQVGYVSPQMQGIINQAAAENPTTIAQACQELRTGPYEGALEVAKERFAAHGLSADQAAESLDAMIIYCRSH